MRRVSKRSSAGGAWKIAAVAAIAAAVYIGYQRIEGGATAGSVDLQAEAAILVDASTGDVLYAKNADEPLPPASMSKMMTEILVLDGIHEGTIKWNDKVTATGYAAQVPGARMGLSVGDVITVRELFDAMTVYSANDAAVALAEHIGGSEETFVQRMNMRAERIGLSPGAVFGNASGLSRADIAPYAGAAAEKDSLLTAEDTAKLAGYLIGKYPEVLDVTSRSSVKVPTSQQALAATNWMLKDKPFAYPGNDGLKTGYTPNAGYCFTGTAKRDGKRLISVVMGASSKEARFTETMALYDMGFEVEKRTIAAAVGK
ncbi:D-alanyl-D-alanine carboxypeptidase family protein [Paenibacillus sp. LHD-117]|uniref:D-alanyl-D-alanine carboxypeptidase family protein n=1 Tax=Paenibacillus sp. LHD-117 TaxID=3071412 RepID=UPI0027DF91E5|nr:D-alanyl-D-alanine carboxypeptidase family protein [Paenibacillus sp. LHD-117]MDQ6418556.1 D-alanyl-D-alanine carboxypeptidase family protein [Paenibacillus sp. LHD-117]